MFVCVCRTVILCYRLYGNTGFTQPLLLLPAVLNIVCNTARYSCVYSTNTFVEGEDGMLKYTAATHYFYKL